jgi:hypothetical protein
MVTIVSVSDMAPYTISSTGIPSFTSGWDCQPRDGLSDDHNRKVVTNVKDNAVLKVSYRDDEYQRLSCTEFHTKIARISRFFKLGHVPLRFGHNLLVTYSNNEEWIAAADRGPSIADEVTRSFFSGSLVWSVQSTTCCSFAAKYAMKSCFRCNTFSGGGSYAPIFHQRESAKLHAAWNRIAQRLLKKNAAVCL